MNVPSIVAEKNRIVEGAEFNNAYFNIQLDVPIIMAKPTNYSGVLSQPNRECRLVLSLYGTRQVEMLWGSLIDADLKVWVFVLSSFDKLLYFKRESASFIILILVVENMLLASNDETLIARFNTELQHSFDVNLDGYLPLLIARYITRHDKHITSNQKCTPCGLFSAAVCQRSLP